MIYNTFYNKYPRGTGLKYQGTTTEQLLEEVKNRARLITTMVKKLKIKNKEPWKTKKTNERYINKEFIDFIKIPK